MAGTLTAVAIAKASDGKLFDGNGLMLLKRGDKGSWVYRYTYLGRRRQMGLGPWPALGLAAARKERDRWQAELVSGRDPITIRDDMRRAEAAKRDQADPTLADAVKLVFEARKNTLRGQGSRGRWRSPLDRHILPKIGKRRLAAIHQTDIKEALEPIWHKKHPTASKAIERLRIVFRECRLMGFECDPFTVDAAARMLGAVAHIPQSIPATPWREIPDLYERLPDSAPGNCLRLLILTGVRMDAARRARPDEFDGDLWIIPADRIKGRRGKVADFRVPLSPEAQRVVERLKELGTPYLFQSPFTVRPITDAAVEKALRALGETGRPHGFRTSFRTWCQDHDIGFDVAEAVLGHVVGGKVERAYARSDLLDRRRPVMDAWAAFVTRTSGADVRQT